MKKITLILSLTLLAACGSESETQENINDYSYALQTIASDYTSSQVAIGDLNGDRQPKLNVLAKAKSDYTIDTYKNVLHHIGKYQIDTIDSYNANDSLSAPIKSFSANFENSGSSNTYKLLQVSDSVAYLVQYGRSDILQVNLTASNNENLVTARIDLSAYNAEGVNTPNPSDAVISGNYLFIAMQRFDSNYVANTAYVAVIDISDHSNPVEIDTNPQIAGLLGIELEGTNPISMATYNNILLVSSRGDYSSNTGTIEKIDTSTFDHQTLLDETSLTGYNNTEGEGASYYHFNQVAINSNSKAYVSINVESGYNLLSTHLLELDLTNNNTNEVELGALKKIKTLTFSPNNRLWIGSSDSSTPGVLVIDTDTNTQNQSYIQTDLPVFDIEFLEVNVNQ